MHRRLGVTVAMLSLAAAACTSGQADEGTAARPSGGAGTSTATPGSAAPATPGEGSGSGDRPVTWVVSVGDSYISGEGARFAGNTSGDRDAIDALGPTAYDDGPAGERLPGCHRAELWPGLVDLPGVGSRNLACSGARTTSYRSGTVFRPGLDFARAAASGSAGQLQQLRRFASRHEVSDVVVSIGGNDVGFGRLVASCLVAFLDPLQEAERCSADAMLARQLTAPALDAVSDDVAAALRRVATAMRRAGYDSSDYSITVTTYPGPVPPADRIRYTERQRRAQQGGCPIADADADWAAREVLPSINGVVRTGVARSGLPNAAVLDLSGTLVGHRLCEEGAARMDELAVDSWEERGVAAAVEWVNEVSFDFTRTQESLHPNYWGTQALRACVTETVAAEVRRDVRCVVHTVGGGRDQPTPGVRLVR